MGNNDIHYDNISDLGSKIRQKQISPLELTQIYLKRIEYFDDTLSSFITVMREDAVKRAEEMGKAIQSGNYFGPLHGIPIAVKDIVSTKGILTTAGSKLLSTNIPKENSSIIDKLVKSGAILIGKLNLSEFAIGGTTDHPYGTPRNPWNTNHTPGGSSSGSGVAVAGGLCAGALGSDTLGSIRGPSSYCGIVGLRPTYGRVTRHGVVPMSWSLDTIGPMSRSVKDCAVLLRAIAGQDRRDSSSKSIEVPDYLSQINKEIQGFKIAVPKEMFEFEGLNNEVRDALSDAISIFETLGVSTSNVSLPMSARSGAVGVSIADVEAASFHIDNLKSRGNEYDWNTRNRLETAAIMPANLYMKAQRARSIIRQELDGLLQDNDMIITPTSPVLPPKVEQSTGLPGGLYEGDTDMGRRRFISPAALAGLPAISIPCGFSNDGLPIGLQLITRAFNEEQLFQAGYSYERETEWHLSHPPI